MSSTGRVTILEEIRKRIRLKECAELVVVGSGDTIILKPISTPALIKGKERKTADTPTLNELIKSLPQKRQVKIRTRASQLIDQVRSSAKTKPRRQNEKR